MSNSVSGKLIQLIKAHPVLYDPTHADYRTKEIVEPLWQEIALKLNEHDMELRKRWRNLRDNYVKLLRMIKTNENDEVFRAAAIRKYYKWIWTKEMEFFRPFLTIGNKLDEIDLSIRDIDGIDCAIDEKTPREKKTKNTRPVRETKGQPLKKIKKNISPTPSRSSISRRTKQMCASSKEFQEKYNSQKSPTTPNPTELDATDQLFLAHSQNIKQFSARRQAIIKLKIAEVIMEQEILDQEEKEAAATSVFSTTKSKKVKKRNFKEIQLQDEDSIMPFETVCGYETEEGDEIEATTRYKSEQYEEDPVEEDRENNYDSSF